jgi:heme exporter protein D
MNRMSPAVAIVSAVVFTGSIFAVVLTILRHLNRKFEAETLEQKRRDERYRAEQQKNSSGPQP